MAISFNRSLCCNLHETTAREWLVTNGRGGYAAGTIAGMLTRLQHGLLVAKPQHAVTPLLFLAKIDEEIIFDERTYYLGTNEYQDGSLSPTGFVHLESFCIEDNSPIFTYRLGGLDGITLEKRIWMAQGYNTTYIQYRVLRTSTATTGPDRNGTTSDTNLKISPPQTEKPPQTLTLTLLPFAAYRQIDQVQYGSNEYHFQVQTHSTDEQTSRNTMTSDIHLPAGVAGCTIQAHATALPYHILAVGHPGSQPTFIPTGVWYWHVLHRQDAATSRATVEDLYLPGVIRATLNSEEGSVLTIVVSAEELSPQLYQFDCLHLSYTENVERLQNLLQYTLHPHCTNNTRKTVSDQGTETARVTNSNTRILPLATTTNPYAGGLEYLRLLVQTSDRFIAYYTSSLPFNKQERSLFCDDTLNDILVISDYYSMEMKTRDALITLPGLTLTTGRYADARHILRRFAGYFQDGMLPDRLPLPGYPLLDSDYANADCTLWFFYALDCYLQTTLDDAFLEEIFQQLTDCIYRYVQGSRHGIYLDPTDGLLVAHIPGKALTWMNANIDGVLMTQRAGKPVELNALWYYALCLMFEWAQRLNRNATYYQDLLVRCKDSFQERFWYAEGGYLYDVIDGPQGNDTTLRPNQLWALSLRYTVLDIQRHQHIMDVITQYLLTPYGLRTLAPHDPAYRGHLGKAYSEQQQALHQGSIYAWLIGPYIDSMLALRALPEGKEQDYSLCHEYLWRKGLRLLEPFRERFTVGLLEMCEGLADGDAPYTPGPSVASALSNAELLRSYEKLTQLRDIQHSQILSLESQDILK